MRIVPHTGAAMMKRPNRTDAPRALPDDADGFCMRHIRWPHDEPSNHALAMAPARRVVIVGVPRGDSRQELRQGSNGTDVAITVQ